MSIVEWAQSNEIIDTHCPTHAFNHLELFFFLIVTTFVCFSKMNRGSNGDVIMAFYIYSTDDIIFTRQPHHFKLSWAQSFKIKLTFFGHNFYAMHRLNPINIKCNSEFCAHRTHMIQKWGSGHKVIEFKSLNHLIIIAHSFFERFFFEFLKSLCKLLPLIRNDIIQWS